MNLDTFKTWSSRAAGWMVGGALAWAGVLKLGDPARFAADIERYQLVGPGVAAALAVYLPWFEIGLGLGLGWRDAWRRAAVWLAGALLLGFSAALALAWVRGLQIDCGCFGGGSASAPQALARNAVLLGLLAWAGRR